MATNNTQQIASQTFNSIISKISLDLHLLFSSVACFILGILALLFIHYEEYSAFFVAFGFFTICLTVVIFKKYLSLRIQYFILFTTISFAIFYFSSYCDYFCGIYLYNISLLLAIACSFNLKIKKEKRQFIFHFSISIILFIIDTATNHSLFKTIEYSEEKIQVFLNINIFLAFISYTLFIYLLLNLTITQGQLKKQLSTEELKNNQLEISNLKSKKIFLAEINHRVNNNLSLIYSLLKYKMQKVDFDKSTNEEILHALQTISLGNNQFQLENNSMVVKSKTYFKDLLFAWKTITTHDEEFEDNNFENIILNVNDFILNVRSAIPIGLIIHEFLVHHKNINTPLQIYKLEITIRIENNIICVQIKSDSFKENLINKNQFLLINTLVEQVDASIEFDQQCETYTVQLYDSRQESLIDSEQLFS